MRLAASANTEVDLLSLFAVPLLSTTTKYIATNYKVDIVKLGPHLKKALKAGVEKKRPLLEGIVSPCHQELRPATNSTLKDYPRTKSYFRKRKWPTYFSDTAPTVSIVGHAPTPSKTVKDTRSSLPPHGHSEYTRSLT